MNLPASQIPEFATGITGRGPLYRETQNQLMQGLAQGEWSAGSALPTEPQLAKHFGVSIGTIRKAIGELVDANILIRQQGRGTFVATHNVSRNLFHFFHIVAKDGVKRVPMPELISFASTKAGAEVAAALDIARGEKVFRVLNLQHIGDVPVCLDELHISARIFKGLTRDEFINRPSTIYALYQSRYLVNVVRTVERLRARSADAETAKILRLKKGAPVLEIHRVAFTYDDRPVELRVSQVNTEQHDYFNTLT